MNTFPVLADLVARIRCKPGWHFRLVDDKEGLRLRISVEGPNSRNAGDIFVSHFFPVPLASYNYKTWRRWIFECCRGVENHELGEFFMDGQERPSAPLHGPGENPYVIVEYRPEVDGHTTQDGSIEQNNSGA